MNLIILLLALNAVPVSEGAQIPTVTVRKPYVSQAEYYSMACERAEWNKPWKEPKVLKGNSLADRLRHDPE